MLKIFKHGNAFLESYLEIIEEIKKNKSLFFIAFDASKVNDLFDIFLLFMRVFPKLHFAFHFIFSHYLKRLNELIKIFRKTTYIYIYYFNLYLHFIRFISTKFYLKFSYSSSIKHI